MRRGPIRWIALTANVSAVLVLLSSMSAIGQSLPTSSYPSFPSGNQGVPSPGNSTSSSDFPMTHDPNLAHRQMISRRDEMRRRMVENATRIVALTRQLQTELQSREPTADDSKRLDEIAKLARNVRYQMRQ